MNRSPRSCFVGAVSVAVILSFASASFAALNIDFGETGAPAGELEPGFSAFPLTNASAYQGTFLDFAGTGLDNGNPVRVTINGTATAAAAQRLVDRGDVGWLGGKNALLRDWVGIDSRTTTTGNGLDTIIRLENLKPGFYSYRSYNTDIGTGGNQVSVIDFLANGSLLVNNFQVRSQVGTVTTTTPNFFDTVFFTDGSPVDLTYRATQTSGTGIGFPVINGFELNAVPADVTQTFRIDVDTTTGGAINTNPGWTSLNATSGNGANVAVDGVTFTVASSDGSRNRVASGPNPLTTDFIFDDGPGEDVGLVVSGLPDGVWTAQVWAFDGDFPATVGNQIVGLLEGGIGGVETVIGSFPANASAPIATFTFHSNGASDYYIFVREDNDNGPGGRARFNALQLTKAPVPEPASAMLGLLGAMALALRRRRAA